MDSPNIATLIPEILRMTDKVYNLVAQAYHADSSFEQIYNKMKAQQRTTERWILQLRSAVGNNLSLSVSAEHIAELSEVLRRLKSYHWSTESIYRPGPRTCNDAGGLEPLSLASYDKFYGMVEILETLDTILMKINLPVAPYLDSEAQARRAIYSQLSSAHDQDANYLRPSEMHEICLSTMSTAMNFGDKSARLLDVPHNKLYQWGAKQFNVPGSLDDLVATDSERHNFVTLMYFITLGRIMAHMENVFKLLYSENPSHDLRSALQTVNAVLATDEVRPSLPVQLDIALDLDGRSSLAREVGEKLLGIDKDIQAIAREVDFLFETLDSITIWRNEYLSPQSQ